MEINFLHRLFNSQLLFQENLVVWKFLFCRFPFILWLWVSGELSSMEIFSRPWQREAQAWFQENLVVWKLFSFLYIPLHIFCFRRTQQYGNTLLWPYLLATCLVSGELSSMEIEHIEMFCRGDDMLGFRRTQQYGNCSLRR